MFRGKLAARLCLPLTLVRRFLELLLFVLGSPSNDRPFNVDQLVTNLTTLQRQHTQHFLHRVTVLCGDRCVLRLGLANITNSCAVRYRVYTTKLRQSPLVINALEFLLSLSLFEFPIKRGDCIAGELTVEAWERDALIWWNEKTETLRLPFMTVRVLVRDTDVDLPCAAMLDERRVAMSPADLEELSIQMLAMRMRLVQRLQPGKDVTLAGLFPHHPDCKTAHAPIPCPGSDDYNITNLRKVMPRNWYAVKPGFYLVGKVQCRTNASGIVHYAVCRAVHLLTHSTRRRLWRTSAATNASVPAVT